jgi:hypothetical protein
MDDMMALPWSLGPLVLPIYFAREFAAPGSGAELSKV